MPGPDVIEERYRIERDLLGEAAVPADALYGIHTTRALANFALGGPTMADRPGLVVALARVKIAAALANARLGVLDGRRAGAIAEAGREVAAGRWHDQFPLPVLQGGGGTSANMNANEVLANRANELLGFARGAYDPVHPNDHVNRSQSTNDVYPTALAVAVVEAGAGALSGLAHLWAALEAKAAELGELERLGRTCLQDAVPLTVRDTHLAQAHALGRTSADLRAALDGLQAVPLGATVVGTGLGAPRGYRGLAISLLAEETRLPLEPARDPFDALAHLDPYLRVAAALNRATLVMAKLAADLRLLASGPIGGIGEVELPAVQAGSSAMPGKVNPVIPELVLQVSFDVRGTVTTIEAAVAAGELELNVMEPVVARRLPDSLDDVGRVARLLADRCVAGLAWREETLRAHLRGSLAGVVERASAEGYAAASEPARARRPAP
ncbi:MAG: lyase family protein [Gaiellales bacterium]